VEGTVVGELDIQGHLVGKPGEFAFEDVFVFGFLHIEFWLEGRMRMVGRVALSSILARGSIVLVTALREEREEGRERAAEKKK